jgi:hypothetical protein
MCEEERAMSATMSWKRWSIGISSICLLMGSVLSSPAAAQSLLDTTTTTVTNTTTTVTNTTTTVVPTTPSADVVLYEVTEAVGSKGKGAAGGFKSSHATLAGVARIGTAPCPDVIATVAMGGCWIVVRATGRADDTTGIGPFVGSFEVVVQDKNATDAPETVVLRGHVAGDIDLSPAFTQGKPLGTLVGTYTLKGLQNTVMAGKTIKGSFTGKFRLPYTVSGQVLYMLDDLLTNVLVDPAEYVLGYPAVKLEITLQ